MSKPLDEILRIAKELNVNIETATLCGTMYLKYKEDKETISGVQAKVYEPAVKAIFIKDGECDHLLACFDEEQLSELAKNIKEASQYKRFVYNIPYDYDQLFGPGEKVHGEKDFSIPLHYFTEFTRLDALVFKLMIDCHINNDDAEKKKAWSQADFEKFKLSVEFEKRPCSMDDFLTIKSEFAASNYIGGLTFAQYYNWETKSLEMLTEDMRLTEETLQTTNRMMEVWTTKDRDETRYWMTRNLEVHPRHEHVFYEFIDQYQKPLEEEGA